MHVQNTQVRARGFGLLLRLFKTLFAAAMPLTFVTAYARRDHSSRGERISRRAIRSSPRSWTERAYAKLIYYNKVDKGGHFAAWEQPLLFAAEVRAAFSSLRQANESAVSR